LPDRVLSASLSRNIPELPSGSFAILSATAQKQKGRGNAAPFFVG
jgi:hypothetical protein